MRITVTPDRMKSLEAAFMAEHRVPGALLMEHAAQAVCAALTRRKPGGAALFLCGPGNNGGDGYAAARLWQAVGGRAQLWAMPGETRGDAAMNRALALQCGVPVRPLSACPDALPDVDVVVDALFGTGLSRPADGLASELIRLINRSGLPVVAVDVPSGLDGTTGEALGCAVQATETVTFHRVKQGLLLRDGPLYAGQITVAPILIPDSDGEPDGLRLLTTADISRLLPPRPATAHKGTMGRAVLLVGSPGMAGAAAFCANACVRAGAGLTTVLCRASILPIVQTLAPAAVCVPLPERDGLLAPEAEALTFRALSAADAACVGCGLGQGVDLLPLLRQFAVADCPTVWDADALNLLSMHEGLLPLSERAVITPHPGEAARLCDLPVSFFIEEPLEALRQLQALCGCTVLLKGARTLMTDGETVAVNGYGSPAMAKGGSGDVLSGILTALLARHLPCPMLETVQLAALLHGLAGLWAAGQDGENALTPQRLLEGIGRPVKECGPLPIRMSNSLSP